MKFLSFLILTIASTTFVSSETKIKAMGPYYNEENPYVPTVWNYDFSQPFNDCPVCTVADKCGPYCWVYCYLYINFYVN